jgi:hypothetical protein
MVCGVQSSKGCEREVDSRHLVGTTEQKDWDSRVEAWADECPTSAYKGSVP